MTDPLHPDHPDTLDELASAHLDGATSAEEAARIAGDPALQVRVEELRAVRDAIAALPPIDAARRDAAIDAALAAFAETDAGTSASPIAAVTSLTAVAARRRSPTRYLRLVGAAAAVVLLAALVPLLGRLGDSDDDDSASADRSQTLTEAGDASAGGGNAPAAGSSGSTTAAAGQTVDLGHFDALAGLVAALESSGTPAAGATPEDLSAQTEGDGGVGCPSERNRYSSAESAESVRVVTATVAGHPVVVLVVTDADGERSIQVLRADTCAVLLERPL